MLFVIACVCSRRGLYEPEFEYLSRDRPESRQNRDKIVPGPGDLAVAHGPSDGSYVGNARQPRGRIWSTSAPVSVPGGPVLRARLGSNARDSTRTRRARPVEDRGGVVGGAHLPVEHEKHYGSDDEARAQDDHPQYSWRWCRSETWGWSCVSATWRCRCAWGCSRIVCVIGGASPACVARPGGPRAASGRRPATAPLPGQKRRR